METGGFALYVAALALAPLALVQSVGAGGIGLLALGSARMSARPLSAREGRGRGDLGPRPAAPRALADRRPPQSARGSVVAIVAWLAGTAALAVFVLLGTRRFIGADAAFGIAGGLLFSVGDISTKVATQGGARIAFAATLVAGYVLGTSLLQIGYQRGAALAVAGHRDAPDQRAADRRRHGAAARSGAERRAGRAASPRLRDRRRRRDPARPPTGRSAERADARPHDAGT